MPDISGKPSVPKIRIRDRLLGHHNCIVGTLIAIFMIGSTISFYLVAGILGIQDFYILGGLFTLFIIVVLIVMIIFNFCPAYNQRKIDPRLVQGSAASLNGSRIDVNSMFSASKLNLRTETNKTTGNELQVPGRQTGVHNVGFSSSKTDTNEQQISISPQGSTTNLKTGSRPESVIIDMKSRISSASSHRQ